MLAIRHCLIAVVGAGLLAGCEGVPAPQSKAVDEQAAIAIAKERCHGKEPQVVYKRWYAALHQDIWHVWLTLKPGVQDEPQHGGDPEHDYLDIHIRASDGAAGDCGVIVG